MSAMAAALAYVRDLSLPDRRRVIVAISRGGFYKPDNAFEDVVYYLMSFFNLMVIEP